jgi:hypothetical protein
MLRISWSPKYSGTLHGGVEFLFLVGPLWSVQIDERFCGQFLRWILCAIAVSIRAAET